MTIINKVSSKTLMPGITAVPDVVDAPTIGTATDVGTSRAYNNGAATVTFTASATGGAASSFTATSSPGGLTASGASSPLTVTGLSSATSYTFSVQGVNTSGTWPASSASNSITATTVPQAPTIGTFTDGGTGTTGTLSFTAGATGGSSITGYKYSTDGTNYSSASGTTSPLSLTGLTAGTYTFYLKATNANGDSSASSGVSGTVIQPTAFESIATYTFNNTTTTYTFSNIPQTYKSLQIRLTGTGTWQTVKMTFNGDTGSNYNSHWVLGSGGSLGAGAGISGASALYTSIGGAGSGPTATYPLTSMAEVNDYASSTTYKTQRAVSMHNRNDTGNGHISLYSGTWRNTNAITSITIDAGGNFFQAGYLTLYGIN